MNEELKAYKEKLEKAIAQYMEMPVSQRSAMAVKEMVTCWEHINDMESACEMTMEE